MGELYSRDPLIKELKGYTAKFLDCYENNIPVTDSHPLLVRFEECLESIFYSGIKVQTSLFGYFWDGSAWRWIEKIEKTDDFYDDFYQISRIIESVKQRRNVQSQDGRFRLAVRYCLVRKCLNRPIESLILSKRCEKYYVIDGILADEILTEIFLSVIYQLNMVDFKLDLENSSMLDFSWELPRLIDVELVPSTDLGISIDFACNRGIIRRIRPNSVAFECPEISIGDILECINSVQINSTLQTSWSSLLKTTRVQPVYLRIVKAVLIKHGEYEIHPAMNKLYKDIQMDPEIVLNFLRPKVPKTVDNLREIKSLTGFHVVYLGNTSSGRYHDVRAIDKAFSSFNWQTPQATKDKKHQKQEVLFEVNDLGIKFSNARSKRIIKRHVFMEITACSGVTLMPCYFAYIVGDGGTNSNHNYRCYFFVAPNNDLSLIILQLMGQGFRRTHFAV